MMGGFGREVEVEVSLAASRYVRVFEAGDIAGSASGVSRRLEVVNISTSDGLVHPASKLEATTPFKLTEDGEILYLDDPSRMAELNENEKGGSSKVRIKTLVVYNKDSDDERNFVLDILVSFVQDKSPGNDCVGDYTCSEFSLQDECKIAYALGAQNGHCEWVAENR